jgi:hypothetical protein
LRTSSWRAAVAKARLSLVRQPAALAPSAVAFSTRHPHFNSFNMDAELQLSNTNTTYASLLSTEEFSHRVKTLDQRDQLEFYQSIFHANSLIEQYSHKLVFRAWGWIEQHQLY